MNLRHTDHDNFLQINAEGDFNLDLLASYIRYAYGERILSNNAHLMLDIREVWGLMPSSLLLILYHSAELMRKILPSLEDVKLAIVENEFASYGSQYRNTIESFTLYGIAIMVTSDYKQGVEWVEDA